QTIAEGQEVDIAVSGVTHKVKVVGASSTTQAVISIDGTSKEVTEGNTYTIAGVDVFIESVFYFGKESQLSQVKLSLGSSKITLEQGAAVKVGQTEDTIDGTLVTLTGTANQGISKLEISVTAKDSSTDYILAGGSFTDPVFGALKVAFGGLNLGTTETITVDNSGTTAANLKFTSYGGNEKTLIWAYAPASGTFTADLNSTSTRAYHVIEGETVSKNDFVLLAPSQESEFGHIFEYSAASSLGSSGAYIELRDVMSLDTTRIYLTGSGGGGSYTSATFYVDGQSYHVMNATSPINTLQKMIFTWGDGSSAGTAGNYTAFPLIKTKNGGYVTLVKTAAGFGAGTAAGLYYQLPGDTTYHLIQNSTTSVTAGRLDYKFTVGNLATGATLISINTTAGSGVGLVTAPAVLIYEEKGKDTSDTDRQNAVIVTVADGSGSNTDVTVQTPVMTDGSGSGFVSQQADNSVSEAYDRYGVHVTFDTDGQGLVTIAYPDDQATAMVAAGSNPAFTSSGTSGTYDSAVKLKNPVAKFDTEVSTSLTADVILIGGPCANALVGTLLSSTENTLCSSDANGFITKYPNGMIKEVANAFSSGHKALIVAGVNGAQTRSLAGRVMQGTLAYPA
ncbi:MAG TPA: hypothetical protein VJ485_00665, partial [archaeon]|nr:hypothetical protein [archaeon]